MIIITSFTIEPVIACLYRRNQSRTLKRSGHKYLEWASNATLQLQRLAYQGIGSGTWSGYTDDVPMTESGALLGDLTQSYPEEPKDQQQGPGSPAKTIHNTAILPTVTVDPTDGASEAATGDSNASGAAQTLVPEARGSHPIPPSAPSSLGGGEPDEHERDLPRPAASLGSAAVSVTPGSYTDLISPVSPLPTQERAAVSTNGFSPHRGASGNHTVINDE